MNRLKIKTGITLIALVITIVVMLILGAVSIGAINGGLFDYAEKAKYHAEFTSKEEGIKESIILAENKSKNGEITIEELQDALDKVFGKRVARAIKNEGGITIGIEDKYYAMDDKGEIEAGREITRFENAGDITKTGQGTKSDPYKIRCIEDLVGFSRMIAAVSDDTSKAYSGKYVVLTRDLDFNSIYSYNDYSAKYKYNSSANAYEEDSDSDTTIMDLCTTGRGFIPIGNTYSTTGKCYWGNFNGQGYTIKNLFINKSGYAAFFNGFGTGTLENLTIEGNITSTNTWAAGFIYYGGSCTIKNCVNKANVNAASRASGIIAKGGSSPINDCGNEGNITSTGEGVIAGITSETRTLNRCYNTGNITGYGGQAVGMCGAGGIVTNCYNTGNITDTYTAAGGMTYGSITAKNCYNKGTITGPCKAWSEHSNYRWGVARILPGI